MPKTAPSFGRILAMVVFSLSCFGLLLFLWLSFGGPIPLKPEGYRMKVNFPEATTLAEEADVRIAGVNVGKVKKKELNKGLAATTVEIEIEEKYAPIRENTRAVLRQKTLLGETFVELTPGHNPGGFLEEGGTLKPGQIEPTVELDEILQVFDPDTKQAFREWVKSGAQSITGESESFNDAFGNLARFARDGADVFQVLDDQRGAVRRLVRDTGVVFGALNERRGALRSLIVNSNRTFEALASEQDSLAETFEIFPTFLDESRLTLARLEEFSIDTHPLIRDLKPVADDLAPTVRDLSFVGPDLEQLFRDLRPLIRASRTGLPAAERFLRGARPVFRGLHPFLQELNPVLSYANFSQDVLAHFLSDGAAATTYRPDRVNGVPYYLLAQYGAINSKSLAFASRMPAYDRGQAYIHGNDLFRAPSFGVIESFECTATNGEKRDPTDQAPNMQDLPPCFVRPRSLWDGNQFPNLNSGRAPVRPQPGFLEGRRGAGPDHNLR
jgi:phospholipid/cholesterol/gamma-HCH transport system substrate-binding protein